MRTPQQWEMIVHVERELLTARAARRMRLGPLPQSPRRPLPGWTRLRRAGRAVTGWPGSLLRGRAWRWRRQPGSGLGGV